MNSKWNNKLLGKLMAYIGHIICVAGIFWSNLWIFAGGFILVISGGFLHEVNEQ